MVVWYSHLFNNYPQFVEWALISLYHLNLASLSILIISFPKVYLKVYLFFSVYA